jgi:hypothetical protein
MINQDSFVQWATNLTYQGLFSFAYFVGDVTYPLGSIKGYSQLHHILPLQQRFYFELLLLVMSFIPPWLNINSPMIWVNWIILVLDLVILVWELWLFGMDLAENGMSFRRKETESILMGVVGLLLERSGKIGHRKFDSA